MTVGTLAWTCLWLTLGQTATPEVAYYNQLNHKVPVNFQQDARRAEIVELRLFATKDQGKSWEQVGAIPPERDAFTFYAKEDGTYGLRVAIVNRQGKQEPENVAAGQPDQVMVIDTKKPKINSFEAKVQGDEIVVAWDVQEEYPDGSSFRVEYQPKGGTLWSAAAISRPGLAGQDKFRPATGGPLVLRLSLRDLAGNQSHAFAEVNAAGPVIAGFTNPTSPVVAQASIPNAPPTLAAEIPVPNQVSAFGNAPPPPVTLAKDNSILHQSLSQAPPELATKIAIPIQEAARAIPPTTAPRVNVQPETPVQPEEKVIADSRWTPPTPAPVTKASAPPTPESAPPMPNLPPPVTTMSARKPLPPLQYVNQPEVVLEFELTKVGPSGIGSVYLYATEDDGQKWSPFAFDKMPPESAINPRQQRTVTLSRDGVVKEGIYGFSLIVKNGAGIGRAAPKTGDLPEIRIELDTTAPVAELREPVRDANRPNALLMRWKASDKNLGKAPITLEYSEKGERDWQPIATDVANTGQHSWSLPEKIAPYVYLRLRVKDAAGNESVAATQQPVAIDLSEPESRLVEVTTPQRRP